MILDKWNTGVCLPNIPIGPAVQTALQPNLEKDLNLAHSTTLDHFRRTFQAKIDIL